MATLAETQAAMARVRAEGEAARARVRALNTQARELQAQIARVARGGPRHGRGHEVGHLDQRIGDRREFLVERVPHGAS